MYNVQLTAAYIPRSFAIVSLRLLVTPVASKLHQLAAVTLRVALRAL